MFCINDFPEELLLVLLHRLPGDVTELSILTDLVGWPGADGVTVHVNNRLLAHVQPDDLVGLGIGLSAYFVDGDLKTCKGGLSTAVDLVARHSAEVGNTLNLLRQLLDLFEVILHGSSLPYLRIISHDCVVYE